MSRSTPDCDNQLCLLFVPDLFHRFSVIITSTLSERGCGDSCSFSHKRISEVRDWCWVRRLDTVSITVHPKGIQLGWGQSPVQDARVLLLQPSQTMSFWTIHRGIVMLKQVWGPWFHRCKILILLHTKKILDNGIKNSETLRQQVGEHPTYGCPYSLGHIL